MLQLFPMLFYPVHLVKLQNNVNRDLSWKSWDKTPAQIKWDEVQSHTCFWGLCPEKVWLFPGIFWQSLFQCCTTLAERISLEHWAFRICLVLSFLFLLFFSPLVNLYHLLEDELNKPSSYPSRIACCALWPPVQSLPLISVLLCCYCGQSKRLFVRPQGRCSTWEWLLLSVAPYAFVKGAKYTVSIYYLQGMVMVCVVVHHGHFCKASQPAQPLLLREVILLQEYSFGVYLRALEGSLFFFFLKHLPLDFALVRIRVATKTKSTVKNSSK